MDRLVDFGLPALVFLALVVWLLRKVMRAARTESDLEGERLTGVLAQELRAAKAVAAASTGAAPRLVVPLVAPAPGPLGPLDGADVRGASKEHLQIVEALALEREATLRAAHTGESDFERRIEVLWARSTTTHAIWCERRNPATLAAAGMVREVIWVAKIEDGRATERWSF